MTNLREPANRLDLDEIRLLRQRARSVSRTAVSDLQPFLRENDTFKRLPLHRGARAVDIATTCTALMCIASLPPHDRTDIHAVEVVRNSLDEIFKRKLWKSSNLEDGNPFTTLIVLRTVGTVLAAGLISQKEVADLRRRDQSPGELAAGILASAPESLRLGDYPPTAAFAYWLADAVDLLEAQAPDEHWQQLADWATLEFHAQLGRVATGHDATKDPVAMVMAAALCRRLRSLSMDLNRDIPESIASGLPSDYELHQSMQLLFAEQLTSGIWPRYFPLFHYPDAGENHLFAFEYLEALLHEFGQIEKPAVLRGLARAVDWCIQNRLRYSSDGTVYCGWNSGGQIHTLRGGQPESWATATVHIYLSMLERFLSAACSSRVLEQYHATYGERGPLWDDLVDSEVELVGEPATSAKRILEKEMIEPIRTTGGTQLPRRKSALLFGPPGTSKTTIVRALAVKIGWPFVLVNPSAFLSDGLWNIYGRADDVFGDLVDLDRAVVLFDEMDGLVQSRDESTDGGRLDAAGQFLTTSMLPKLAMLNDVGRILFFMATNHRSSFDTAILRPGRFDLLICMGPPSWARKLDRLELFWASGKPNPVDLAKAQEKLRAKFYDGHELVKHLDHFTFEEFRAMLEHLVERQQKPLSEILTTDRGLQKFETTARQWSEVYIILRESNRELEEYKKDKTESRRQ